jgi:hypothetical protein
LGLETSVHTDAFDSRSASGEIALDGGVVETPPPEHAASIQARIAHTKDARELATTVRFIA